MLFAVEAMDPTVQVVFYAVAIGLFVLAAVGVTVGRLSALGLGLAVAWFPAMWNALAAT